MVKTIFKSELKQFTNQGQMNFKVILIFQSDFCEEETKNYQKKVKHANIFTHG